MSADTNNAPAAQELVMIHSYDPERDTTFQALASSSVYRKGRQNKILLKCTQCQTAMEKPRHCAKCKSVLYCSKECQKQHWPTHKLGCNEVEQSSSRGALFKLIRTLGVNPLIMMYLKVAIVLECGLLRNPRVGFEVPFVAHVDIGLEPSDVFDFMGLYFDGNWAAGEKLQGMAQVNAITPWHPGMKGADPLTPQRQLQWREARIKHNTGRFAKDPVGLLDLTCVGLSSTAISFECHINSVVLEMAREREPFERTCPLTGTRFQQPFSAMRCLEYINMHIRADMQNKLHLRTEMTEQDKEVIRAAGRNEDTDPARTLRQKMERELMYSSVVRHTRGIPERARAGRPEVRISCPCGFLGCKGLAAPLPQPNLHVCTVRCEYTSLVISHFC
ncbi:hypothetical protein DEU56DRAFT_73672 [Suillus clintonianus]|uniref:uncharacterized protein n=1 Tax=Suillus clintonianus TaxID=1904413 RepID=UPI001B882FE2|nr:uncharacterized protein DEU56DRAFT_73672 [Suillus clintonianus]KAG2122477.1 hypothetical protein DEU56DRAFT_73672 [Suillus clintonianus]